MLGTKPTTSLASLRAVFIDERIHLYGPDLHERLLFGSFTDLAEATPRGTATVVELGSLDLAGDRPFDPAHPLCEIQETAGPSVWINLPGLFGLYEGSPHPLGGAFARWRAQQETYGSILATPETLIDEGMQLLRDALGSVVRVLAVLHCPDVRDPSDLTGQVLDPPALLDLADLVGFCLEDEAYLAHAVAVE